MKAVKISRTLIGLTSNLVALSSENEKFLDSVRRIISYNLRSNRQEFLALKSQSTKLEFEPSNEKILEFGKYAVTKLLKEDQFLVRRLGTKDLVPVIGIQTSDISLPINPIETPNEWRWNQKRGEQIGPFLSADGHSVWFNLYYYEDKLTVRSQAGNIPYFLFSKATRSLWFHPLNNNQAVDLKAGYVWILGKLLAHEANNNEYVGFNIKGGTFALSNTTQWNGQYLDFQGDFTGKLTLKLTQPEKNASTFEGSPAAQDIVFQYPDEVTFDWKNGALTNITCDRGHFMGFGNDLEFSGFHVPATDESDINHILIPCDAKPGTWKADFSASSIFEASGNPTIMKSSWALPVVKVSNPATLGEPQSNGGWALGLSSDITSKWVGMKKAHAEAMLNDALLLLYPQSLFLYSVNTTIQVASATEIQYDFSCWQLSLENAARIPLSIRHQNTFSLAYYCHAIEGEAVLASCQGQMQTDRPVFADGFRAAMKDLKGWVLFQAKGIDINISSLLENQEALKSDPKLLVLENALMVVSLPVGLILAGTLSKQDTNCIEKGQLTLAHGLLRWKPTLPDPYVSNLQQGWESQDRSREFSSALFAQTSWGTNVPTTALATLTFKGELPLLAGVGIKFPSGPQIRSLPVQLDEPTLDQIKKHRIDELQRQAKNKINGVFDGLEERLLGWKLLDVSTNMDLIGVGISPFLLRVAQERDLAMAVTDQSYEVSAERAFLIQDLAVCTPLNLVHVFTVPQVQWEPVRTLPEDQNIAALGWFPEYLASATDGGATRLFGISQALTPMIPNLVVRQIRESFGQGHLAAALTTLSFGLKAALTLSPQNSANRNADSLNLSQPEFSQKNMKGGIQISLMAESGHPKWESPSPGFEGFIAQTLNGYELFTGTELGLSVLGATLQPDASVETQFNEEFAITGTNPFVPVTRFDLSGYGASNFSEWDNPGALASIGKVQFKIMVGRTVFEVVKFVSKIYPWGTTVTRSVTIERRSGGGVIRKDSGWQATQAGIFDFRVTGIPNNPYEFRPGLFKGCFDLKNIRPASNSIITFNDPANGNQIELAPIYFDANVQLNGQTSGIIFSKGILGFIQLAPKPDTTVHPWLPRLLSTQALQKLITDQGAIGGPIDTMLNVANSGFMFRATRFEVDVTNNAGILNFVGVIRGQPILPHNGSWSVVKIAAPGNTADPQEASSAEVSRGTPLFIENSWLVPTGSQMNVSGPAGPYRFVDATDLFVSQSRYDYGFMQNTGSQAFLFRRPVIVVGTNEISSSLKPAFADPFAMLTSKGVFPPIANAVEFPTATYKLLIQSGSGKLRLSPAVNLHNLRTPLVVTQDGTDQIAIEYDQSDLRINLNYDDWNVELDNFFIWTSLLGISKFSGTRFSLRAGTAQQSKLINVRSLLKPEIQDALSFLPGMGSPADIGDIDLGMTNAKHEVKVHSGFEKEFDFGQVELKFSGDAGVDSEYDTSTAIWQAFFGASVGAELQGKIPVTGIIFIVLGLELEVSLGSSVSPTSSSSASTSITNGFKSLEIDAYVGVGIGGNIGPFKADAYCAVGLVFVYEDNTAKFGGLIMLKAEVDLKIVAVEISAELKGVYYKGDDPDTPAVETNVSLIDGSGEVAVNVSIFLVINISASYEYQTTIKP